MEAEAIELNIGNICNGAVPQLFDREVREVLENIADVNTPADSKRKITLEFTFAPTPDRKSAVVSVSCKSKTSGAEDQAGTIFFRKKLGKIEAFAEDPRQDALFAREKAITPQAQ
jgi:hypothetical protein